MSGVKIGPMATAARRVARTTARKLGNADVSGSLGKHVEVGQGGDYKCVKLGADFPHSQRPGRGNQGHRDVSRQA